MKSSSDKLVYELSGSVTPEYLDPLVCHKCYKRFDLESRKPILLPCEHDICSMHISKDNGIKCPQCQKFHDSDSKFVVNEEKLEVLKEIKEAFTCKKHNKSAINVCLTEKSFICGDCLASPEHIGHIVEPLKDFREKLIEAVKWRKGIESHLEINEETFDKIFESKIQELCSHAQQIFNEQFEGDEDERRKLFEQVASNIKGYINRLKERVNHDIFRTKSNFAMEYKYIDLDVIKELDDPIFGSLKLKELLAELKNWNHEIDIRDIVKRFKDKHLAIKFKINWEKEDSHNISCQIGFESPEAQADFESIAFLEYDLLEGIHEGILGIIRIKQNKHDEAIHLLERALKINNVFLGEDHPNISRCYYGLSLCYMNRQPIEKVLEYLNKSLKICLDSLGELSPTLADIYTAYGLVYRHFHKYDQSLEYLKKALNHMEKRKLGFHEDVVHIYNDIGVTYRHQGKYNKAIKYHTKALKLVKKIYGKIHPETANCYSCIGSMALYGGSSNDGLKNHKKALDIRIQCFGTTHPDVAQSYTNMGMVHKKNKQYQQALDCFKQALSVKESCFGEDSLGIASTCFNIGSVLTHLERYKEALEYQEKALNIRLNGLGERHLDVAKSYFAIGNIYEKKGSEETEKYYEKALKITYELLGEYHNDTMKCRNHLMKIRRNNGAPKSTS